jgi:fumarate reductase subunit C
MNIRSYLVQRISAIVMVPFVVTHLIVIILAVQNGLSAEEILGRTRGSFGWAVFYGVFVLAVSAHAAIGVETVLTEWTTLRQRSATLVAHIFGFLLIIIGLRAIFAVISP